MNMSLLAYFLFTFLITWSVWLGAAALAEPGNTGFFGICGPGFLLGIFAPAQSGHPPAACSDHPLRLLNPPRVHR